jgi:hypothetical protein
MTKFVLAITLAVISGLWVATHRDDTSLQASAAVTSAAQLNLPALPTPSAQEPLPTTESAAEGDAQCDATTMSEDAASCSAGGWSATLTCCHISSGAQERWALGAARKCCGPCFLP